MRVILRQAAISDEHRVAEIYLASRKRYLPYAPLAHTDEAVRDWIGSQLIPTGSVTVAVSKEIVLGFLAVSKDDRYGWIDHLYLDPSAVGLGLGTILLEQAKLTLGAPIRLYTFQENVDARRFYARHGFKEIELTDGALNEEKVPDVLLEWTQRENVASPSRFAAARAIFDEIRNRPYAWSSQIDKPVNNCYFKGIELLQRLGVLGYAVRGRIGETFLDTVIPEEIRLLYPTEFPLTHFWVEVLLNDVWHTLDASYDPGLASAGFNVNEWDSNRTCFEITKTYTQEEAIAYHDVWSDPEYARSYFKAVGPCAMALNEWYESLRKIDHKSVKKF